MSLLACRVIFGRTIGCGKRLHACNKSVTY